MVWSLQGSDLLSSTGSHGRKDAWSQATFASSADGLPAIGGWLSKRAVADAWWRFRDSEP